MKHVIQKILASVAFAANALGAQSFGQDALVNIAGNDGGENQGDQTMNVFSNYDEPRHAGTELLQALVYKQHQIAATDSGTYEFSFDAKAPSEGGISEPTTAFAYIQAINPGDNFSTTSEVQLDMTNVSDTWTRYSFELSVDASVLTDQLLQFGFANTTTGYASSGILHDKTAFGVNND